MAKLFKTRISRILVFIVSISLLFSFACKQNTQVVKEDYPTPEVITDDKEDENDKEHPEENPEVNSEDDNSSEVSLKELEPEPDSLREFGKYVFNPEIIPGFILRQYVDNPKIIKMAKHILTSVYNMEEELVFDEEDTVTNDEFTKAYEAAYLSNPLIEAVDINRLGPDEFTITYLPGMVITGINDFGGAEYAPGEADNTDEARELFKDFEDYVTNTVNNNLNDKSTDEEIARTIYVQLIKDMELSLDPSDNPYARISYEEGDIGKEVSFSGIMVRSVSERKFSNTGLLIRLYSFMLSQLHMDANEVRGMGSFNDDYYPYIEEIIGGDSNPLTSNIPWSWSIVEIEGNYYNCDLLLEKIIYDTDYKEAGVVEPDMLFFGLSDEKRAEYFKADKAGIMSIYSVGGMNFTQGGMSSMREVPECPLNL